MYFRICRVYLVFRVPYYNFVYISPEKGRFFGVKVGSRGGCNHPRSTLLLCTTAGMPVCGSQEVGEIVALGRGLLSGGLAKRLVLCHQLS